MLAQQIVDVAFFQRAPAEGHAAGLFQGDGGARQAEPPLRRPVQTPRQVGVIACASIRSRVETWVCVWAAKLARATSLDLAPGAGLALGDGLQTGQGGGAEVHHIAPVRTQADLFQQGAVVQQGLGDESAASRAPRANARPSPM